MNGDLYPAKIEHLEPNIGKMLPAFQSIGYDFDSAVSDILDNSIDAKATEIYIIFRKKRGSSVDLIIADNGKGIDRQELKEAMRLGSITKKDTNSLGKYGLGLKFASISQTDKLQVISHDENQNYNAMEWTIEGLKKSECNVYDNNSSEKLYSEYTPFKKIKNNTGTIIIWSAIKEIDSNSIDFEENLKKIVNDLKRYIGLYFHRFIERGEIKIFIRVNETDEVKPLNPFGYPAAGLKGYPKKFRVKMSDSLFLELDAHIWPPNSTVPNYKLPEGANKRQGFYFYRNNRLISAGGWHGLRDEEPHTSLSRISLEIGQDHERIIQLDVKKSNIEIPKFLLENIGKAKSVDGTTFKKYIKDCQNLYRKKVEQPNQKSLLIPDLGFSVRTNDKIKKIFGAADKNIEYVNFKWKVLNDNIFFEVLPDDKLIILNQTYRVNVAGPSEKSTQDAPLVKVLLYYLNQKYLTMDRISGKAMMEIQMINDLLVTVVSTK